MNMSENEMLALCYEGVVRRKEHQLEETKDDFEKSYLEFQIKFWQNKILELQK